MEQFSSNTNRQQLTIFEDISRIAEKSSKSGRHRPTDKKQIEENCKDTEISSTKNSPTLKISRKTAYLQKSPRAAGFPARQGSTEASQNPTEPRPEHRQSPRSPRKHPPGLHRGQPEFHEEFHSSSTVFQPVPPVEIP